MTNPNLLLLASIFLFLVGSTMALVTWKVSNSCSAEQGITGCTSDLTSAIYSAGSNGLVILDAGTWSLNQTVSLALSTPVSIVGAGSSTTTITCATIDSTAIILQRATFYFQGFTLSYCGLVSEGAQATMQDVVLYGAPLNGIESSITLRDSGVQKAAGIVLNSGSSLTTEGSFTIDGILNSTQVSLSKSGVLALTLSAWISNGPVVIQNINNITQLGFLVGGTTASWRANGPVLIQRINVPVAQALLYFQQTWTVETFDTFTITQCQVPKNSLIVLGQYSQWNANGDVILTDNLYTFGFAVGSASAVFNGALAISNNTGLEAAALLEGATIITYGSATISGNSFPYSVIAVEGIWYSYGPVSFTNNLGIALFESQTWVAEGDVSFIGNVEHTTTGPLRGSSATGVLLFSGAMWITNGAVLISQNHANISGGGVSLFGATMWESNGPVTLSNNQAGMAAGAVWIQNSLWSSSGPVSISGNNAADFGGGVYIQDGTWANSHFEPQFSSNTAGNNSADIFCVGGSLFSLTSSCNSSTVTCDSCSFGTISNTISFSSTSSITLNNGVQSASFSIILAQALPDDLIVPIELVITSSSLAKGIPSPIIFNPSTSVTIAAGSTTAQFSASVNTTSLSGIGGGLSLQGMVQLLPPTPELLVLIDPTAFSIPFQVSLPSSTSSGARLLDSSILLFLHRFISGATMW